MNNIIVLAILAHLLASPSFAASQIDFVKTGGTLEHTSRSFPLKGVPAVSIHRRKGADLISLDDPAAVGSLAGTFADGRLPAEPRLAPEIAYKRAMEAKAFQGGMLFRGTFSSSNRAIVNDDAGILQPTKNLTVSEPGLTSLMGTGLFGLVLATRRKLQR